MYLRRLHLRSFRNLKDARLELPPEGVAIVAPNAQGKSNLLEAIYYLEILRSFRGARDSQLVRFGAEHFRIEGVVEAVEGDRPFEGGREERTVAAAWQRRGAVKKVAVDGAEPERLSDAIGHLGVVLFSPSDLALVNEGPHERRRFLDIALSLTEPAYLPALQRFRQVLSQRNAALREGGGAPAAAWNDLLVREGATVARFRSGWLARGNPVFAAAHREVSGGEDASLRYEPGIPDVGSGPWEEGELADAFREALAASGERERRQATTVVGPHRDEVRIRLREGGVSAEGTGASGDSAVDGGVPDDSADAGSHAALPAGADAAAARGQAHGPWRDLRTYGSGGQRRNAVLALRLLEADGVRRRKGREPILLMDDVFAELDEDRSARLLAHLERTAGGQVVLTAPKESDVRFRKHHLPRWGLREGEVLT